jgi:hypothetical protein
MTIFGPDISSFEAGVSVSALPDPFVFAKCTEGTYYTDAYYAGWRQQAVATGKIFVAYHFISGEGADAQAQHLAAHIGDRSLPVMIDWEPGSGFTPTFPELLDLADAMAKAGLRPKLAYAPHWHWQNEGSPPLAPLTDRKISLVASSYPNGSAYPGDTSSGWNAYGGVTPTLWQFTDAKTDHGQYVGDYNAFRGTATELAALLGGSAPTGGTAMPNIPPSIGQKWPEIASDFPANANYTVETALIWADGGARAAALYALQARDAINALAAHLAAPSVDVNALAAALAPHLAAGATADQVAQAVVAHLASTLALGGHAAG